MRVIVKDDDGDRVSYGDDVARVEHTASDHLRLWLDETTSDDWAPDEWAWYRVENPEVHDG